MIWLFDLRLVIVDVCRMTVKVKEKDRNQYITINDKVNLPVRVNVDRNLLWHIQTKGPVVIKEDRSINLT